ncbi:unnamed protein product [Calypogeia fissa]
MGSMCWVVRGVAHKSAQFDLFASPVKIGASFLSQHTLRGRKQKEIGARASLTSHLRSGRATLTRDAS